jgi:symplekin
MSSWCVFPLARRSPADHYQLAAGVEDEAEEIMTFSDFKLPPPEPLDSSEKHGMVDIAVQRIWTSGGDLASLPDLVLPASDGVKVAVQPKEMWMLLLARLTTRGADVKRKVISDYVVSDFASR